MRARVSPSPALLLVTSLLALPIPIAQGQPSGGEEAPLEVVATSTGCPEGQALCYQVENASSALTPGEEVTIVFENRGEDGHTLYVANGSRVDTEHRDTRGSLALASTGEVRPGEQTSLDVTIPDGDMLYLWCDVGSHETDGMWTEIPIDASSENATGPEQGSDRSPPPGVGVLLAIVCGLALLVRGRR